MSEEYYITNFDLMMISDIFNIPLTLIAPHTFRENDKEYLCLNIHKGETFIIRTSGINKYRHDIPKYKMIVNKGMNGLLLIRELPEKKIQDEINNQNNSLINLLQTYKNIDEPDEDKKIPKKIPKKITNKKLILM